MSNYHDTYKCASCRTWNVKTDYYDNIKNKEYRSCSLCRDRQKRKYAEKKALQKGGKLIPKCPYEGYDNISNQLCYNNDLRKIKPIVYEEEEPEEKSQEYLDELDEMQNIAVQIIKKRGLDMSNNTYRDSKGDFYNENKELILRKLDMDYFYKYNKEYGEAVWDKAKANIKKINPRVNIKVRKV